jgi:signal transduction histidine kinase/CheY-like chemotaxis protein
MKLLGKKNLRFNTLIEDETFTPKQLKEYIYEFPINNPYPVLSFTISGELVFHNLAAEEIVLYLRTDGGNQFLERVVNLFKGSESKAIDYILINNKNFECSFAPSSTREYFNLYARDITEEIRHRNGLVEASEQALAASLAKSEFLANMSHEIRSPLNIILGYLDVLMSTVRDKDNLLILKKVFKASSHLAMLLNNVLDISKIEERKIEISVDKVELRQMFESIVFMNNMTAQEKEITLDYSIDEDLPTWVLCDHLRVKQILQNLISNAIKFTDNKGSVHLEFTQKDNNTVVCHVSDTGIGIPVERQTDIFGKFTQSDSSITKRYGGTGLGLTISKQLSERLGGSLVLSSSDSSGSQFTFTFPLLVTSKSKQGLLDNSYLDKSLEESKKMLIVDDSQDNVIIVKTFLGGLNFIIDTAENGKVAVNKCKKNYYDVILMDMQMPVMGGEEATRKIRKHEVNNNNKASLIYALSANAFSSHVDCMSQAGCDGFIAKPISRKSFVELIKKISW